MRAWVTRVAGIVALTLAFQATADVKTLHAELVKHLPGITVDQLRPSPIAGWFELSFGDGVAYVTEDGKYLIQGDLFEVATRVNLTQSRHNEARRIAMAQLNEDDAIVFSPPTPKHTITVFTDVDCPYCRKLHSDIAKYNEQGIRVRYVAYPRSGPGSETWETMEAVWCSKDRRDALTRAKRGEKVERPADCKTTAIASEYALALKVGVQGTPMILLENGGVISGYMPAEQLAEQLKLLETQKTAVAHSP